MHCVEQIKATKPTANQSLALNEYLEPLMPFLDNPANTEIVINRPGEVITESLAGWTYHTVENVTFVYLERLSRLVASHTGQVLDGEHPILSATLPGGERIQIVIPPATRQHTISMTIRKPASTAYTLADYRQQGMFDACVEHQNGLTDIEKNLLCLKQEGRFEEFLKLAVQSHKNIIISGSTGSGKTTFFKSLLNLVPQDERLISIENVDELGLWRTHKNTVSLFYAAGGQGIASITQQHLLESSLRMKPDRIFVAELIRGDEAFYFLRNVNSGHPGSITTMHANSARLAIEQLVLFLKESQSGQGMSREDIKSLVGMCVDIIIQIKNVRGKRKVTEIYYDPAKFMNHV